MSDLSLSHSASAEDIGYALAGCNEREIALFARDLMQKLEYEIGNSDSIKAFAAAIAKEMARIEAEDD